MKVGGARPLNCRVLFAGPGTGCRRRETNVTRSAEPWKRCLCRYLHSDARGAVIDYFTDQGTAGELVVGVTRSSRFSLGRKTALGIGLRVSAFCLAIPDLESQICRANF
jgi:hypothetical protein